jgi:uncharacterized membrane-anchored protein YhcB (DUF1043 family)
MPLSLKSLLEAGKKAFVGKVKEYLPEPTPKRPVFKKSVSNQLTTQLGYKESKPSVFSKTLGTIKNQIGRVKEVAQLVKKGREDILTQEEALRLERSPVYKTLLTLKKLPTQQPVFKPYDPTAPKIERRPISDVFSKGLSSGFQRMTGIKSKWSEPIIKKSISYAKKKLGEKKGYTMDEVRDKVSLKLIEEYGIGVKGVTRDFLGQRDDSYLDYEWEQLEPKEQKEIINNILKEKGDKYKKQIQYEKKLSPADRYELLRQQYGPAAADLTPRQLEEQKIFRESFKNALGAFGKGVLSGASVGVSDQLIDSMSKNQPTPPKFQVIGLTKKDKRETQKLQQSMNAIVGAYQILGTFVGGAKTYSAIAGRIGKGLQAIEKTGGRFGTFMKNHPVLTAYTVQNGLEEVAEFGIRKATGQEYTPQDFLLGITMGSVFTRLGIGQIKRETAVRKLEQSVKDAEIAKGNKLTQDELFNTVMTTKLDKDNTFGQLFGESKYAYYKGRKKGDPGLDIPAPLPRTKEAIAKDISPYRQAEQYVKEYGQKQKEARRAEKGTWQQRASDVKMYLKKKFVDKMAPVEDVVREAQKKYKFKLLPEKNFADQVDRVLRTTSIATRFIEDNGLAQLIREAPDLNKLDQYLIARHTKRLERMGIETGRDLKKDQIILDEFKAEYEPHAKAATAYSQKVLDYITDAGLISKADNQKLKELYPEYVPINRVISEFELDKAEKGFGKNTIANLTKQNIVKKLKGSKREIENPTVNLLDYTYKAFQQAEKNIAARMLAGYHRLPGLENYIKEIQSGRKLETPEAKRQRIMEGKAYEEVGPKHKMTFLEDGKAKEFEIPKEWEEAVKGLTPDNLGLLGRMMMVPVRLFKSGTTGLNLAFGGANVWKDAMTAIINSKYGSLSPQNFLTGIKEAISHGEFYKGLTRYGAGGTQFDLARNQLKSTIKDIRAGRGKTKLGRAARKTVHAFKSPAKFLRAAEDIIGRTEEFTRLRVADATYRKLKKQGMSDERAMIMATREYNNVTANFIRGGQLKKLITVFSPYQAAGFAGARAFLRAVKRNPGKTAIKLASYILLPEMVVNTWNLMDPERAEIYKDIRGFEKDNNWIIILPGATKDDKNKWNVIKIPKPPGIGKMAIPVRKELERFYISEEGTEFQDFANALLEPTSGLDFGNPLNTVMPQIFKPAIEAQTNYKFFTGRQLVPDGLQYLPPEQQAYDYTSGTARKIGETLKISPIHVEHYIKGYLGAVGAQAMHHTDRMLAGAGVIPPEQVGGKGVIEDLTGRFTKAAGGEKRSRIYEAERALEEERAREKAEMRNKLRAFVNEGNKQGLSDYYNGLSDTDKRFIDKEIDKLAEEKMVEEGEKTDTEVTLEKQTSKVIYEYYKKDITKALKSDDRDSLQQILDSIPSETKRESVLDMILANKAELIAA